MIDREPEELRMKIYKDPIDAMASCTLNVSGNVSLGTTTPGAYLSVRGMNATAKYSQKLIDEAMSFYGTETIIKRKKAHRSITDDWEVSRFD